MFQGGGGKDRGGRNKYIIITNMRKGITEKLIQTSSYTKIYIVQKSTTCTKAMYYKYYVIVLE